MSFSDIVLCNTRESCNGRHCFGILCSGEQALCHRIISDIKECRFPRAVPLILIRQWLEKLQVLTLCLPPHRRAAVPSLCLCFRALLLWGGHLQLEVVSIYCIKVESPTIGFHQSCQVPNSPLLNPLAAPIFFPKWGPRPHFALMQPEERLQTLCNTQESCNGRHCFGILRSGEQALCKCHRIISAAARVGHDG